METDYYTTTEFADLTGKSKSTIANAVSKMRKSRKDIGKIVKIDIELVHSKDKTSTWIKIL